MTHLHKQRAAALITAALIAVLMFTACPNFAGGSGSSGGAGSTGGTGGSSGGGTPPADKTYTVGGVEFTMKKIAAVTNGTVGHTDNAGDNAPHTVSLLAYRIGETEVTQELWQAVMGTNPSN
ncbi:MAG: formylglycine-generating enzyme family protein, partial [Treponema sp.]